MADDSKKTGGVKITAGVNMKEDYQKFLQIIELIDDLKALIPDYREAEANEIYKRIISIGEDMIIVSEEEI